MGDGLKYLLLVLILLIVVLVLKAVKAAQARPRSRGTGPGTEDMVRCAQCGVHVPRSEGLMSGRRFYCTPEHRRLHQNTD